jgi:hypothetical protein
MCTYVYIHIHIYVNTDTHIYVFTYIHIYIYIYLHLCIFLYIGHCMKVFETDATTSSTGKKYSTIYVTGIVYYYFDIFIIIKVIVGICY